MSGPLFITGHAGLAGAALVRAADAAGRRVVTASRAELDLRDAAAVAAFLAEHRPAAIIHAAARNAGMAVHEARPAEMLADNLAIASGVIQTAAAARVPRLLYVSSAAVYAGQGPHKEAEAATAIGDGAMSGYALAKAAGMKLCEAVRKQHGLCYHSIIPCNLYGPGDNFNPDHATVLPGMMRRMHGAILRHAPAFSIWGSGRQSREFLHTDDLAAACLLLLALPDPPARVNCGMGETVPLMALAELLKAVAGFDGAVRCDPSKPDGAPRFPLDCSLLHSLGWSPRVPLDEGVRETWKAFHAAHLAGTLRGG